MTNQLDAFEKEIEKEADQYRPMAGEKKKHMEQILSAAKKAKNINIRLSEMDLEMIRRQAAFSGLPYQTFIASILHRYLNHQLVDEKSLYTALNLVQNRKRTRI
jgi:predicted DNA binding CopG/RHH family protein